jgi:hypothetical protein
MRVRRSIAMLRRPNLISPSYVVAAAQLRVKVIDSRDIQKAFDFTFSNYSVNEKSTADDSELDAYLKLPVESVQDPLKWWDDHRKIYPNLSQMAMDYLSILGPSISLLLKRRD